MRVQAILLNMFSRLLLAFPGLPYLVVVIITRRTMNMMRMKVMIMMVVVKILCVVDVEGARGGDGQGKVREDHHLSFTQIGLNYKSWREAISGQKRCFIWKSTTSIHGGHGGVSPGGRIVLEKCCS